MNVEGQAVDISLMGLILVIAWTVWLIINLIVGATARRRRIVFVEKRRETLKCSRLSVEQKKAV